MRTRLPLVAFLTWTLLVWVSRMRNVLADDDLSSLGTVWRLGAAALFVALAIAVAVARRVTPERFSLALMLLVGWTIGWWLIRGVGIIIDDHELGFTIVHSILMVVSIGLAMWAWLRRDG